MNINHINTRHFCRPLLCALCGLGVLCGYPCIPSFGQSAQSAMRFAAEGKEFRFDTGTLRGVLHAGGKSTGLTSLVHIPSGATVSRGYGLLSPYRLLDTEARYLPDGWDRVSEAKLLPDGAVEIHWPADKDHPFEMTMVYRLAAPDTLDTIVTITATKDLRQFESFLASYFEGFPQSYGYAKSGFVETEKEMGTWLAFPRDDAAAAIISDGRWQRPPHPVTFKPVATYAGAMGIRRDAKSGLTALVMSPPGDCFAVLMPYGQESHRSLYLSLFGKDFKSGETATARARLVINRGLTNEKSVALYESYLKEIKP